MDGSGLLCYETHLMPTSLITCFAVIHFLAVGFLVLYGLHRLWFLYLWQAIRKRTQAGRALAVAETEPPHVTIQLPLYNERFVAVRLIDAVANITWPQARLEIQVLDDSDDDTRMMVDQRVHHWRSQGLDIRVLRRKSRAGYKAGALAEGLNQARGEFIAVFDADFIPNRDFLIRTMPEFSNVRVGMVQACWSFLNRSYSWLTSVQAILVGHHFDIEHRVRHENGFFLNFNGTAGIWRKHCIETSGGWQSDTVTEDLDLSYRAQMKGWEFAYCYDCRVPSELPVTMASFRRQQQRWACGSTQTALKILPGLLTSTLPFARKREALFHLLSNLCWLMGFVAILTLYPAMMFRIGIGPRQMLCFDLPLFLSSGGAILTYFFLYARGMNLKTLRHLPLIPLVSMGLAPSIALSILTGGWRRGGVFERTPKYGVTDHDDNRVSNQFYRLSIGPSLILNAGLAVYTSMPLVFAWQRETWPAVPFLMFFPLGFLLVMAQDLSGLSWSESPVHTEEEQAIS